MWPSLATKPGKRAEEIAGHFTRAEGDLLETKIKNMMAQRWRQKHWVLSQYGQPQEKMEDQWENSKPWRGLVRNKRPNQGICNWLLQEIMHNRRNQ